jgi:5-oxoprolinase (ATP-hydrolysing)
VATPTADVVGLELFTHRFTALVREMGERLRRTALSTNVKERLDFSCGLLDADNRLVVNAPHIPVHLGALGICARAVEATLAPGPGDVVVTNHPGYGGSHLPDVTLLTPVFDEGGWRLGTVASRAHHAEIGGTRPGSMPPDATRLVEEGVVVAPMLLVASGEPRWEAVRSLLTGAPYPSRAVEENLADLSAMLAANHRGAEVLRELAAAHGAAVVARYMRRLRELSAERVRARLRTLEDGLREAEQRLDDGAPIRVALRVDGERMTVDFAGSSPVHPGNLNATEAVVRSAVLYVVRLLLDEPLPLNEGLLDPVTIAIPEGMLAPRFPDDPARCPAVVGGNVETSQRVVDTLLDALDLAAASQGTMNNVLFGNDRFGYYETVAGGSGAGPGFAGTDAVHTHMTNTRITDPEVLEHRFPVRLERFAIRRGSGGGGRWPGGEGVERELVFREAVRLSILSQRRREGPYGKAGGEPGARGEQWIVTADGTRRELGGIDGADLVAGDRLVLRTPGGGGWGWEDVP